MKYLTRQPIQLRPELRADLRACTQRYQKMKIYGSNRIEIILERPTMFFEEDSNYVECISALGFGFNMGFHAAIESNEKKELAYYSIFPEGLSEFVIEKLGKDEKRPNWIYRIQDTTNSKEEAFELMKRLYQEFKKKGDNQSVVTTPDAARPTS